MKSVRAHAPSLETCLFPDILIIPLQTWFNGLSVVYNWIHLSIFDIIFSLTDTQLKPGIGVFNIMYKIWTVVTDELLLKLLSFDFAHKAYDDSA